MAIERYLLRRPASIMRNDASSVMRGSRFSMKLFQLSIVRSSSEPCSLPRSDSPARIRRLRGATISWTLVRASCQVWTSPGCCFEKPSSTASQKGLASVSSDSVLVGNCSRCLSCWQIQSKLSLALSVKDGLVIILVSFDAGSSLVGGLSSSNSCDVGTGRGSKSLAVALMTLYALGRGFASGWRKGLELGLISIDGTGRSG